MGIEIIGNVGGISSGANSDLAFELASVWLSFAIGDPPAGVSIELVSQDHDFGTYNTVAVCWDEAFCLTRPSSFIRMAEDALSRFDRAVEWGDLDPSDYWEAIT